MDKGKLEKAFNDFDQDKNGSIDVSELRNVVSAYFEMVGQTANDAEVDKTVGSILATVDTSRDGKLDKAEFLKYFE